MFMLKLNFSNIILFNHDKIKYEKTVNVAYNQLYLAKLNSSFRTRQTTALCQKISKTSQIKIFSILGDFEAQGLVFQQRLAF